MIFSKLMESSQNWSAHAKDYESKLGMLFQQFIKDALIIAAKEIQNCNSTLDIASGTGAFTELLAEQPQLQVTASDFSESMLSILSSKPYSKKLINVICVDGQTLNGIPDNQFSLVTSSFGIPLFESPEMGWSSANRVLAKDGILIAISWKSDSQFLLFLDSFGPGSSKVNRNFDKLGLEYELGMAGFQNIRVYSTSHDLVFESGQRFMSTLHTNPYFMSITQSMSKEDILQQAAQFFNKSLTNFLDEPVIVTGTCLICVAKK